MQHFAAAQSHSQHMLKVQLIMQDLCLKLQHEGLE